MPRAEQVMPNAIYRHTRNERVIRIDHPPWPGPSGRCHAGVGRSRPTPQGRSVGTSSLAGVRWLPRTSTGFVLAVAVKQRQRPNCTRNHSLYVGPSLVIGGKLRRCLVKISRFFEKIIVANHPIEQLCRFTIRLAGGTIVGRSRQHLRQALGQVAATLEQLGQARVNRLHDRRFAATELHALKRKPAFGFELHMHAMADVVSHTMAVPTSTRRLCCQVSAARSHAAARLSAGVN